MEQTGENGAWMRERNQPSRTATMLSHKRFQRPFVLPLTAGVAYLIGAGIGLVFRLPPTTPSVLWPPNAILTTLLLFTSPSRWWLVFLGALPAHLIMELGIWPPVMVATLFLTNCSEGLLAASCIRRFSDSPTRFNTTRRIAVFVGASVMAPFISSFLDAAAVATFSGEQYWEVWRARFLSNVLTQIAIVPTLAGLIHLSRETDSRWRLYRWEALAIGAGFLLVSIALATDLGPVGTVPRAPLVFYLPFLLWAAARFGPTGAGLSILATALAASATALYGNGLLDGWQPEDRVTALQTFLIATAAPLLFVGALVEERGEAERALKERLRFEEMLARLSGLFVHLPSDKMDAEFVRSLQHLRENFDLDTAILFEFHEDNLAVQVGRDGTAESARLLRELQLARDFPALRRALCSGRTSVVCSPADLPADAHHDCESLKRFGLQCLVLVPLVTEDSVFGALMLANTAAPVNWSGALLERLPLVAALLANALARKRAEGALRGSEFMKSAILASLSNHVGVVDQHGFLIAVNSSWARFANEHGGMAEGAVVGTSYIHICRRAAQRGIAGAEAAVEGLEAVLRGSQPSFTLEYSSHASDGQTWVLMSVVPLQRPEGGAVVTYTDRTERKRAELEAQRSREELAHLTRVAVVGELTASLAHQLNQPLAGILSNAQAGRRFLEAESPDLSELRAIFNDIVEDDTRAAEVIRRLRDMLRKGSTELEILDLNELARESVKLIIGDAIIRNVSIRLDLSPSPLVLSGDRVQLQQVVLNLLLNAMEAVETSQRTRRVVVLATALRDDAAAEVSVADSGAGLGLPAGSEHLVFEPFYTTKPTGLGLGLSIARSIIEAHGGKLGASNGDGTGAVFRVTLPLDRKDA